MDDNYIGDDGAAYIAHALRSPNCRLVSLDLDNNPIGDAGAAAIAASLLSPTSSLVTLVLGRSTASHPPEATIGPAGATAIAAALRGSKTLTALDLAGNAIGDDGACAIAAALEAPTSRLEVCDIIISTCFKKM